MDIFTALAEPTRRSIIEMLAEKGELSATDISDKFDSSPPAISQHLKVLREANLVSVKKRSRQRIYQVNPGAMNELGQWMKRFDRLDKILQLEKNKLKTQRSQKYGK